MKFIFSEQVLCIEIKNNIETYEADQVPINIGDDLPNCHDRGNNETRNAERAESQKKKNRFSFSHNEGTVEFISIYLLLKYYNNF